MEAQIPQAFTGPPVGYETMPGSATAVAHAGWAFIGQDDETSEIQSAGFNGATFQCYGRSELPADDLRRAFHDWVLPNIGKVHIIYTHHAGNYLFDIKVGGEIGNIRFYDGIVVAGIEPTQFVKFLAGYSRNDAYIRRLDNMKEIAISTFGYAVNYASESQCAGGIENWLQYYETRKSILNPAGGDDTKPRFTGNEIKVKKRGTAGATEPNKETAKPWLTSLSDITNTIANAFSNDCLPKTEAEIDAVFETIDGIRQKAKGILQKITVHSKEARRTLSGSLYPLPSDEKENNVSGFKVPCTPSRAASQSLAANGALLATPSTPKDVPINPRKRQRETVVEEPAQPQKRQKRQLKVPGEKPQRIYRAKKKDHNSRDCIIVNPARWAFIAELVFCQELSTADALVKINSDKTMLGGLAIDASNLGLATVNHSSFTVEQGRYIIATIDMQFIPAFGRFPSHPDDWSTRNKALKDGDRARELCFFSALYGWFDNVYLNKDMPSDLRRPDGTSDDHMADKMRKKCATLYWSYTLRGVISNIEKARLQKRGVAAPTDPVTIDDRLARREYYETHGIEGAGTSYMIMPDLPAPVDEPTPVKKRSHKKKVVAPAKEEACVDTLMGNVPFALEEDSDANVDRQLLEEDSNANVDPQLLNASPLSFDGSTISPTLLQQPDLSDNLNTGLTFGTGSLDAQLFDFHTHAGTPASRRASGSRSWSGNFSAGLF